MKKTNIKEITDRININEFIKSYHIERLTTKQLCGRYNIKPYPLKVLLKHLELFDRKSYGLWMKEKRITHIITDLGLTREVMDHLYNTEQYSLPDFKKFYNLEYDTTINILKFYNIATRNISASKNTLRSKVKTIKTLQQKYGNSVTNVSQISEVKEKKRQTFLNNYGVDNIRKSHSFYNWLDNYMINRYGKKRITDPEKISIYQKKVWTNRTDEEKTIQYHKTFGKGRGGSVSKLEIDFMHYLYCMGIDFIHGYKINKKTYDYKILGTDILIEIHGDFWHGNPEIYKADDIVFFSKNNPIIVKDLWKKDEKKLELAIKNNYNLIVVWEKFLKSEQEEKVLEFLYNEIKKYTK